MVDRRGVRPDPDAVEAVLTWKASLSGMCQLLARVHKRIRRQGAPKLQLMRNKGKKLEWNERAQRAFKNIQREQCKASVLSCPRRNAGTFSTLMLQW